MKFQFLARACGGLGPDTWDQEIEVEGEDMTIRQALDAAEAKMQKRGCIVSIEQVD